MELFCEYSGQSDYTMKIFVGVHERMYYSLIYVGATSFLSSGVNEALLYFP